MKPVLFLALITLLLSCNNRPENDPASKRTVSSGKQEINAQADTSSTDYLIYLLKNGKSLNHHWTEKLKIIEARTLPPDSMSHLSLIRDWSINDSVSIIIISYATGTGYDEYLVPVKNKRFFIDKLHISDEDDSDLSPGHPYYYTEYKLVNDSSVTIFHHEVTGSQDDNDKNRLISTETWTIHGNGKLLKK